MAVRKGTSIRIFLVEGSSTGLVTAGIGQWTGQSIVVPRTKLSELVQRSEAGQPGVYFLVGEDPIENGKARVYIGESEQVGDRLKNHESKKDFWSEACIFTTSDESLTKVHVKYLESRLLEITKESGKACLDNQTGSTPPHLPEADRSDMEFFIDRVLVLLPVLGFDFCMPNTSSLVASSKGDDPVFVYSVDDASARLIVLDDKFVVLKGSTGTTRAKVSWDSYQSLHKELVDQGVLIVKPSNPKHYVFTRDCSFSSLSAAAAVINMGNKSGPKAWKVEGLGVSYSQWESQA